MLVDGFGQHPTVMDVGIPQAKKRQHRRTDIRVIGPGAVVLTEIAHARPDDSQPDRRDLRLDSSVIPRERGGRRCRWHGDARGRAVRRAGEQEVVRMREHREGRRSLWVGGYHV